MSALLVLASVLVLTPTVDEDTELRAIATGTEGTVRWLVDGQEAARSGDGEAIPLRLSAGRHEVHAVTQHEGAWEVLLRPDPAVGSGAAYVPAWTARHEPAPHAGPAEARQNGWQVPSWTAPAVVALAGAILVAWPERRPKGP